jgi:hypothetical protein
MTAGHGIAHSEESPADHDPGLHGVQLWLALPGADRQAATRLRASRQLPVLGLGRVRGDRLRRVAGGCHLPGPDLLPARRRRDPCGPGRKRHHPAGPRPRARGLRGQRGRGRGPAFGVRWQPAVPGDRAPRARSSPGGRAPGCSSSAASRWARPCSCGGTSSGGPRTTSSRRHGRGRAASVSGRSGLPRPAPGRPAARCGAPGPPRLRVLIRRCRGRTAQQKLLNGCSVWMPSPGTRRRRGG